MGELSENEIKEKLGEIDGWEYNGERIRKKYQFEKYMDGIEFVNKIAEIAEEENHHPDMILGFREVEITLKSHDVDAITDRDINLASKIEKIEK